jgi:hypothetical protein
MELLHLLRLLDSMRHLKLLHLRLLREKLRQLKWLLLLEPMRRSHRRRLRLWTEEHKSKMVPRRETEGMKKTSRVVSVFSWSRGMPLRWIGESDWVNL